VAVFAFGGLATGYCLAGLRPASISAHRPWPLALLGSWDEWPVQSRSQRFLARLRAVRAPRGSPLTFFLWRNADGTAARRAQSPQQ
jgi:hypothetical protein